MRIDRESRRAVDLQGLRYENRQTWQGYQELKGPDPNFRASMIVDDGVSGGGFGTDISLLPREEMIE